MSTHLTLEPTTTQDAQVIAFRRAVREAFGVDFHWCDEQGECVEPANSPIPSEGWLCELIRAAGQQNEPQLFSDTTGLTWLAMPFKAMQTRSIAVAPFVTGEVVSTESAWIRQQPVWPAHALERLAKQTLAAWNASQRVEQLRGEVDKISNNLASSYEEISLLHSISQNFRLSSSDEQLGAMALEWLGDCITAEGLALIYLPVAKAGDATYKARTQTALLVDGDCPFDVAEALLETLDRLGASQRNSPLVVNRNRSELAKELPDVVEQFIVSPMKEGDRTFGYLLAFNHTSGEEFGTVEANLIASVSAMLGVHCSNRDLYRQQAEFLASVVRALTSAIDAKDPYTCGHSDRVARVSTRIAKELGCEQDFLSTIYMAGLLHDIGKIGIDDAVLRKPGRLTEGEFEHIKQHPSLGYRILADIKPLADVLPAVLHHHEQWDGHGYPCELEGDQIPFMARIVAVADAYDAMTSDRPYRPGMPEEKVRKIFDDGCGKQWDPEVLGAFASAYDDIRAIVAQDRAGLSLDVQQWLA